MKVVVAMDSWSEFKGAAAVTAALAQRLRADGHEVVECPMADGGDGTTLVLARATGCKVRGERATGPDRSPIEVPTCALAGGLFIESARVIGRALCPDPKRPMEMTSLGLGNLMVRMEHRGEGPLLIGLGGSGTLDGGLGLAQGLGLEPLDATGAPIPRGAGAAALGAVRRLEGELPLPYTAVQTWSDVDTPLFDSARVFGAQKGARPAEIEAITEGLRYWYDAVADWRDRLGLRAVPETLRGGGAAGGLGFALTALAGAFQTRGSSAVARAVRLDDAMSRADVVVTGEGCLDRSALQGKVVGEVVRRARAQEVCTVLAFAGAQREPIAGPAEGPDVVLVCEGLPGEHRDERFAAGLDEVAKALIVG